MQNPDYPNPTIGKLLNRYGRKYFHLFSLAIGVALLASFAVYQLIPKYVLLESKIQLPRIANHGLAEEEEYRIILDQVLAQTNGNSPGNSEGLILHSTVFSRARGGSNPIALNLQILSKDEKRATEFLTRVQGEISQKMERVIQTNQERLKLEQEIYLATKQLRLEWLKNPPKSHLSNLLDKVALLVLQQSEIEYSRRYSEISTMITVEGVKNLQTRLIHAQYRTPNLRMVLLMSFIVVSFALIMIIASKEGLFLKMAES